MTNDVQMPILFLSCFITTVTSYEFYYIYVVCSPLKFEDLLVIGTRYFKFPTQALTYRSPIKQDATEMQQVMQS